MPKQSSRTAVPPPPGPSLSSDGAAESSHRRTWIAAALILIGAGAVRLLAGLDGLWLDEIWSLRLASQVRGPWDILTRIGHENNHYLNTLWIWTIGPQSNWLLYRIPSMFAGVLATGIAGSIGLRRSTIAAVLAMLIAAASYLLIHYSSEARGYSCAVLFALASADLQERMFRGGGWGAAVGTIFAAIAGILSQPVFLAFYGALLMWSAGKTWFAGRQRRRLSRLWCLAHVPPLLFFVWLYETDLWRVFNAGGPIYPLSEVVTQTLSLAIGGPDAGTASIAGAACAALLFLAGLAILWQTDRDWCILSVLAVVVMPTVLIAVTGRREVYPRYFLIPVTFIQLTLALAVAAFDLRGRQGRILSGILFACVLAGNSLHAFRLMHVGRGGYFPLLADLVAETPGDEIVVGSDHPFRNGLVLWFYSQYLPETKRLAHLNEDQWPPQGPDWFLLHLLDREAQPPSELKDPKGHRYRLEHFYPYAGLSGWGWGLYRNESAANPPQEPSR